MFGAKIQKLNTSMPLFCLPLRNQRLIIDLPNSIYKVSEGTIVWAKILFICVKTKNNEVY